MNQPTKEAANWRTVFSRVRDAPDGLPRFYVKGSRAHLFAYDGYQGRHEFLNRILEFFGENRSRWKVSDSPLNVSSYSLHQDYDPEGSGSKNCFVVEGGNYVFGDAQGAWVVGFQLFRDLVDHLNLKHPRKLKGEK